jgi:hypothetical protein
MKKEWRYSSTNFNGRFIWKLVVSFTLQPLYPPVLMVQKAPEPVWTLWRRERSVVPTGNRRQVLPFNW